MDAGALFEAVAEHFADSDGFSRAKAFGSPALKVRGKVFASFVRERLVVKLPAERVQAITEAGEGEPYDPGMGTKMKEWAEVPATDEASWVALAEEAHAFVSGTA